MRLCILLTALTLVLCVPAFAGGGETVYLESYTHCAYTVDTTSGRHYSGYLHGNFSTRKTSVTTLHLLDGKAKTLGLSCGSFKARYERRASEGPNPRYSMNYFTGGFIPQAQIYYLGPGH